MPKNNSEICNRFRLNSLAQRFHNAGVIDPEELIRGGDHVNSVRLALGAFAVKKLVYGFVDRLLLKDRLYDLKKGFAQQRRATFGYALGFRGMLPRLIWRRVNTSHCNERFRVIKASYVDDLGDKLRTHNATYAVQAHNGFVFG